MVVSGVLALSLTSCIGSKSPTDIARQVEDSLVLIAYGDVSGQGTGFLLLGPKGVCTVLTAGHVLDVSIDLRLQTYSDRKNWTATNIRRLPNLDAALVTFDPGEAKCPYQALPLGNSDKVKLTDTIYISGFPDLDSPQLTKPFVSGKVTEIKEPPLTQGYGISYNADTATGMSGAPVVNVAGKVIAIHGLADVERLTPSKYLKWGIPINRVKPYIDYTPPLPPKPIDNPFQISTKLTLLNRFGLLGILLIVFGVGWVFPFIWWSKQLRVKAKHWLER